MLRTILNSAGLAALTLAVAAAPASAQHMRGGAGHFGGTHAGAAHFGGGHAAMAPHATFVRPGNHFFAANSFHSGARFSPGHATFNNFGRFNGFHNRGFGYWRNGVWINLGLGYGLNYPYYGYGYPYYAGYGSYYPDYGIGSTGVAPDAGMSAYPPAEVAPPPAAADSARVTVQLPAGALLSIDGQPTAQTGVVRTFETPGGLQPGRIYTYKLVAQWVENGQTVTRDREVSFQAGGEAVVNMNVP